MVRRGGTVEGRLIGNGIIRSGIVGRQWWHGNQLRKFLETTNQ